jgi:tRNA threonylcarbamoyladenosine biosynthesis protein TsaE
MPEMWEKIQEGRSLSLSDLKEAADELLTNCRETKVWLFSGEMGVGKTTLIKTLGERVGIKEVVSSPTFSIINEYQTISGETVYHFDFYRLRREQEAFDIGAEEYFDSGSFCWVEWPEKIPSLIPDERVEIKLMATDAEHRTIQYRKHD